MLKFIIGLAIICSPLCTLAQWNLIYNHGDMENAISVINKDTVVAVTQMGGRIHRTIDGGASWSFDQTIFTQSWFLDVQFPTNMTGYACGGSNFGIHKNVIAKSIDAGATWDSITSNDYSGFNFTKIFFVDPDTGFVAGDFDGLLKTVDGGGTFVPVPFPENGYATALYFNSSKLGFAASEKYVSPSQYRFSILRTQDLGATWTETWVDTMNNVTGISHRMIRDIQFVTPLLGYAVGGNGLFLKTINGGLSWSTSTVSPANELLTVCFTDIITGYTNINNGISKSVNGGINWAPQLITTPTTISQIRFANDSVGYAVGAAGIYKSVQKNLTVALKESIAEEVFKLYPNPTNGKLFVAGKLTDVNEIRIYSLTGQCVQMAAASEVLDVSGFAAGLYFMEVRQGNNIRRIKFLKN